MTTWLANFWTYLKSSFGWLIDGMITAAKYMFYVLEDGFLTMIQTFVTALNVGNLGLDFVSWWGSVPSQVVWILHAINLGQCISMLVYTIGIRVALNLIPAALTRI